jgi:hypothetical protein
MDQDHIVVSTQHQYEAQDSFIKRLFTNKKLLFVVGLVLALELAWAGYTLTRPVPPANFKASAPAEAEVLTPTSASLSLAGLTSVTVGQLFDVDVVITVPIETDATDVIITYDPTKLEVVTTGDQAAKIGTLYSNYPVNSADSTEGRIVLAGATDPGAKAFTGQGVFATLTFKAKARGETTLAFEYSKGSTIDSNIVDSKLGRDILDKVTNLTVKIE